jgi:hypothetical protein
MVGVGCSHDDRRGEKSSIMTPHYKKGDFLIEREWRKLIVEVIEVRWMVYRSYSTYEYNLQEIGGNQFKYYRPCSNIDGQFILLTDQEKGELL